jgi:hypothetical protein
MKAKDDKSAPFTDDEREIWIHLWTAYNKLMGLKSTHPSHLKDFADGINKCQSVLGARVLQRDYPQDFATYQDEVKKKIKRIKEHSSQVDETIRRAKE